MLWFSCAEQPSESRVTKEEEVLLAKVRANQAATAGTLTTKALEMSEKGGKPTHAACIALNHTRYVMCKR